MKQTITWDGIALKRAPDKDFDSTVVWESDGMRVEYWQTSTARPWQRDSLWRAMRRTTTGGTAAGQGATDTESMRNCDHMCKQMG